MTFALRFVGDVFHSPAMSSLVYKMQSREASLHVCVVRARASYVRCYAQGGINGVVSVTKVPDASMLGLDWIVV